MPILNNPRRERFAQRVAEAGNASAAYRSTYGSDGRSAEVGGSRLLRNAEVRGRVQELQGETAKAAVMTLEEQRLLLAAIARGEHLNAKICDRIRAIELDAKLAGFFASADGSANQVVVFNSPTNFENRRGIILTEERRAELMKKKREAIESNRSRV